MTVFRWRALALTAACVGLAACAPSGAGSVTPAPADIPALEAQRAQHPTDPALNFQLAKAYYAADRFADARAALGIVLTQQPSNDAARAYLGFTYEGLEQFDSARVVYTQLLAKKPQGDVAHLLNGRLALLTRHELHAQARLAIAREAQLSRTAPDPHVIAVFPFRYTGADTSLRPLERGIAALMITDFSRVHSLRLVERERLQALLDEMQLAASGRVDPATGARSGKLVGAGQVVQGQFTEIPTSSVRLDAALVRAGDAQVAATGSGQDRLQGLFDLEKGVVFQLLGKMNVPLTPAESVAISERPTRDLQAFLLYSRGLEAQDRGDFSAAAADFQGAVQRDPSFHAAGTQAQGASQAAAGGGASAPEVASGFGGGGVTSAPGGPSDNTTTLTSAINSTVPTGAGIVTSTPTTVQISTPPTDPNRICEAASCSGPQSAVLLGTIIIVIQRP
ncbi:MAG TPA: CsgG/HfaB family protein [Gemmatimonadales bacterium]|nr:CsgG/HfaB family protein [Gemmatimonadales bacterium]